MNTLSKIWYTFEFIANKILYFVFRTLEIIFIGIKSMIDELLTPASHRTGRDFEKFLLKKVFVKDRFDILHMTHDYKTNRGRYIKTSLAPISSFLIVSQIKNFM